ncbi:DUF6009 family protein [Streptomyces sp. MNU76]|uniref:DUF6009 family protein n=1 Tax=Streptomyces sp. MNU76 TaxID=2560026 RepID=UPI0035A93CB8
MYRRPGTRGCCSSRGHTGRERGIVAGGLYASGAPAEAVDPCTLAPGCKGCETGRCEGTAVGGGGELGSTLPLRTAGWRWNGAVRGPGRAARGRTVVRGSGAGTAVAGVAVSRPNR